MIWRNKIISHIYLQPKSTRSSWCGCSTLSQKPQVSPFKIPFSSKKWTWTVLLCCSSVTGLSQRILLEIRKACFFAKSIGNFSWITKLYCAISSENCAKKKIEAFKEKDTHYRNPFMFVKQAPTVPLVRYPYRKRAFFLTKKQKLLFSVPDFEGKTSYFCHHYCPLLANSGYSSREPRHCRRQSQTHSRSDMDPHPPLPDRQGQPASQKINARLAASGVARYEDQELYKGLERRNRPQVCFRDLVGSPPSENHSRLPPDVLPSIFSTIRRDDIWHRTITYRL